MSELRRCVKEEVDVQGSLSLIVSTVCADIKQQLTKKERGGVKRGGGGGGGVFINVGILRIIYRGSVIALTLEAPTVFRRSEQKEAPAEGHAQFRRNREPHSAGEVEAWLVWLLHQRSVSTLPASVTDTRCVDTPILFSRPGWRESGHCDSFFFNVASLRPQRPLWD